jgi:ABC-type glycerol-3-phosphate transport system substrate-binding protein
MRRTWLLFAAAVILLLAACNSKEGAAASPKTAASGHRVLVVGNAHTHTEYYNSEMDPPDPAGDQYERDLLRYNALKAAEQKYNIEITFDSMDMQTTTQSLSNSAMASTPDYDYYFSDLQVAIPAALAGYLRRLEDFIPADDDLWNAQKVFYPVHISGQPDGDTYMFMPQSIQHGAFALGYNKTLLRNKGLADPLELWNAGKWDWAAFRQQLIEMTNITGDRRTNVYGLGVYWNWFLDGMLMSNAAGIARSATEELSSSKTIEVLDFINTIYNIDKTGQPWQNSWNDNNLFRRGNLAFFVARDWIFQDGITSTTEYQFGIVPFPVGPSGNKETNKSNSLTGNAFVFPKNVKDPELVYHALFDTVNWFNYDEDLRDGTLMEELENTLRGEENLNTILDLSRNEKSSGDLWLAINQGEDGEAFSTLPLMAGEVTASQLAETYKNWFQTLLNQAFRK